MKIKKSKFRTINYYNKKKSKVMNKFKRMLIIEIDKKVVLYFKEEYLRI